jgi:hypothetical protein
VSLKPPIGPNIPLVWNDFEDRLDVLSKTWVPDPTAPGASLQAVVNEIVTEGGHGKITGPGGEHVFEQTVSVPAGSAIHMQFAGLASGPTSHNLYGTRLLRSATLAGPILQAVGTGTGSGQRVHLTLEGVELSSKDGAADPTKPLLDVRRGLLNMDKVRLAYSNGLGAYFAELWNANWGSVFLYTCGLSGTTYPAMIFDSVYKATTGTDARLNATAAPSWATIDATATGSNDTATVLIGMLQTENCPGTDLKFTGDQNSTVQALCEDVQIGLVEDGGRHRHPPLHRFGLRPEHRHCEPQVAYVVWADRDADRSASRLCRRGQPREPTSRCRGLERGYAVRG